MILMNVKVEEQEMTFTMKIYDLQIWSIPLKINNCKVGLVKFKLSINPIRGGGLSSTTFLESKPFKNDVICCSEIFWLLLNNDFKHFLYWKVSSKTPPSATFGCRNAFGAMRGGAALAPTSNRPFSSQNWLFRTKLPKIQFLATFV